MSKLCTDHLGNKFNSIKEMREYWKVSITAYYNRKSKGLSLEQCLSTKHGNCSVNILKDHLGNKFDNITKMCEYWNISRSTFNRRKKQGLPLKECLEQMKTNYIVTDHLGNKFNSKADMCKYWNISHSTFNKRKKQGLSLKKCLEQTEKNYISYDHLGNKFDSEADMCRYWNINYSTFNSRKSKKLPLTVSLNIIPYLTKTTRIIFRNIEILHFAYKGIDNLLYFNVIIDNQEMILSDKELYERMEAIVIEEHNNGTFKLPNQTTEKSRN